MLLSKEDQARVVSLYGMLVNPAFSDLKSAILSSPSGVEFFYQACLLLGKIKEDIEGH